MTRLLVRVLPVLLLLGAAPVLAQTADIAVTKHLTPDAPVIVGDHAVFVITVTNHGPDAATGVVVKDHLPTGLAYVSASPTLGWFDSGLKDWHVGSLTVGQSATLTLTTTLLTGQPQVNCATVKTVVQHDPDNTNDADCATVTPKYTGVDLVLEKAVYPDTAPLNAPVTFTVRVTNLGPEDATDILIRDELPQGLQFSHAAPALGSFSGTAWSIPLLPAGQATTLALTAIVKTTDARLNCAALEHVHPHDRDPSNNEACACVNCEPTGGDDSGIESDGRLATLFANRLFERRRAAGEAAAAGLVQRPEAFTAAGVDALSDAFRTASLLGTAFPAEGPASTSAYVSTPGDLLGVTNATAVAAADYLRTDGHRLAAVFGAATPGGVLYDHAKATCDRLAGATLEGVQRVTVAGHPFVMQRLTRADGHVDHSISFVVHRSGEQLVVDSRFAPGEYAVPFAGEEVLNLQVWSVSAAYTRTLAEGVLEALAAHGSLSFLNTAEAPPALPGVYVRRGGYANGVFTLELANPAGATALQVTGERALTESGAPQPVALAFALSGEAVETVQIATGPAFDAVLRLTANATGEDLVYFADAPWSYAFDAAGAFVQQFQTFPQEAPFAPGVIGLERSARMVGTVETWASLYRFVGPQAQPRDLSAAGFVEFEAWGQGTYRVQLEKASVDGWDQFAVTFTAGAPQVHRFAFDAFTRADGSGGFTAEDVVLVGFYPVAGQGPTAFDLTVGQLAFGGNSVSTEDGDAATAFALDAPFPNPAARASRLAFTLPGAADVRLELFDVLGRRVAVLRDGALPAGRHEVTVDAGALSAGAYVVRLRAGDQSATTRLTVLR